MDVMIIMRYFLFILNKNVVTPLLDTLVRYLRHNEGSQHSFHRELRNFSVTLVYSERSKLHRVLAVLCAVRLNVMIIRTQSFLKLCLSEFQGRGSDIIP